MLTIRFPHYGDGTTEIVIDNEDMISLLTRQSHYFQVLLESKHHGGFSETISQCIEFQPPLQPPVVQYVLNYLMHPNKVNNNNNKKKETIDGHDLNECLDYLQIDADTAQAIQILHDPMHVLADECIQQGWMDPNSNNNNIIELPTNKKKRFWRFWACYLLCIAIFPNDGEQPVTTTMDQNTFTQQLEGIRGSEGGAVALRRELIELGLIQRTGDGSEYWRPNYTLTQVRTWIQGMPRKII